MDNFNINIFLKCFCFAFILLLIIKDRRNSCKNIDSSLTKKEVEDMIKFHVKWQESNKDWKHLHEDYRLDLSYMIIKDVDFGLNEEVISLNDPIFKNTTFIDCKFEFRSKNGDWEPGLKAQSIVKSKFVNCQFIDIDINSSIIDCVFNNCSFYQCYLNGEKMTGTIFENCNMGIRKINFDKIVSCDFIESCLSANAKILGEIKDCKVFKKELTDLEEHNEKERKRTNKNWTYDH